MSAGTARATRGEQDCIGPEDIVLHLIVKMTNTLQREKNVHTLGGIATSPLLFGVVPLYSFSRDEGC